MASSLGAQAMDQLWWRCRRGVHASCTTTGRLGSNHRCTSTSPSERSSWSFQQNFLPASYVFPSVGGYDEHVSAFMNTKKMQVRECHWDTHKAMQEGTRELDQHGRAFSRSLPWQKYKLKEFPMEQKWRHKFEVTLLDEIPTLPLDKPDVWWTAAATIKPSFYEEQHHQGATQQLHSGGSGTARSFQPSKRVGSPTRQLPWEWRYLKGADRAQHESIDDSEASEIKISLDQMWHPEEKSDYGTTNAQRRWRGMVSNFERRFFTNDPSKVGTQSGKFVNVSKNLRAFSHYFSAYMGGFLIASHIPQTWIRRYHRFFFVGRLKKRAFSQSQQVDAGPWLPQCVQPPEQAAEYYYGRGAREASDWEMTAHFLGSRDLPRVNAEMEKFSAAGSNDPSGSTVKLEPKTEQVESTSSQPCVQLTPAPAPPSPPPPPPVVDPRAGYGQSAWSQQSWGNQWWSSSQDAWNSWGSQSGWHQQW